MIKTLQKEYPNMRLEELLLYVDTQSGQAQDLDTEVIDASVFLDKVIRSERF